MHYFEMEKRGQVTLFIIIAIVVVAAALFGFFAWQRYQARKEIIIDTEFAAVKQAIQGCTEQMAADSLLLVGFQGGYTDPPNISIETDFAKIAYFFYEGEITAPELEMIEQELENFVDLTLFACLESLNLSQFELSIEEPKTKASIQQESVLFEVNWPILAKKADLTAKFEKSSALFHLRFKEIYNVAYNLANETGSKNSIPLTNMLETNFNITIIPYNESAIVCMIIDPDSTIKNEPYNFWFALKFKLK